MQSDAILHQNQPLIDKIVEIHLLQFQPLNSIAGKGINVLDSDLTVEAAYFSNYICFIY